MSNPLVYAGISGSTIIDPGKGDVHEITPTGNTTYTISSFRPGQNLILVIRTVGASSWTITFGTGFRATGTLATGVTTAKTFVLEFICCQDQYIEMSRTVAM